MKTRTLVALAALCASAWLVPLAVHRAARAEVAAQGNPVGGLSRTPEDLAPVEGTVEERLLAGGYTYLAVRSASGRRTWAVTIGRGASEGDRVVVRSFGRSASFFSRRLQRTFPELVFGLVTKTP
jgi:hypothetical protein